MPKIVVTLIISSTSTDLHAQWVKTNGAFGGQVNCFVLLGRISFPGLKAACLFSTNNGTRRTAVNSGLGDLRVKSLAVSGTNLFAGTKGSVFFFYKQRDKQYCGQFRIDKF